MSDRNPKTIPVKIYLTTEDFLENKAKCDAAGVSMSTGGGLAFRQWEPAHRMRRRGRGDMPKTGLRASYSPTRRGGAPKPHLRV